MELRNLFTRTKAMMSNKQYAHVALNDATGYQNEFQTGYYTQGAYQNRSQNDITTTHSTSLSLLRNVQLRWWGWELVAAGISLAFFAAVIVVLKVYDGHAIPQLPLGITLNTTVSLIAAVSKTALLLVASTTMSQLKWLWIHKSSRRLQDLQAFDEASRGPWGALTLLQHSRFSVASLGALVTLFLLGFDPFIQQLITTPERVLPYEAGSTAVYKASTFNQYAELNVDSVVNGTLARLSGVNAVVNIQSVISNAASNQGQIVNFETTCPTANCTWPTFKSLGMCSTCMDVTEYARNNWVCETDNPSVTVDGVTGNNRTCSYNLPNSAWSYQYLIFGNNTDDLEVAGELRMNVWTTMKSQTSFSKNTFLLVSSLKLENDADLVPGIGREQVLEATECALAMCVEEHDLSTTLGNRTHIVKSSQQPFSMTTAPTATAFLPAFDINPSTIDGVKYSVDGLLTLSNVLINIQSTLTGNVTVEYDVTKKAGAPVVYDGGAVPSSILATSFFAGQNFAETVENVATSVSRYIRGLSEDTTIGQAQNVEVYVRVKWEWLTFPAVLVASGLALLAVAIVQTSHSGLEVWKSSSLPLWFHGSQNGRTKSFGSSLERVNTLVEMEKEAGQIQVTLGKLDDASGAWKVLPTQNDIKSNFI
jgi:hypothetical protein